jgi:hypothetical protein
MVPVFAASRDVHPEALAAVALFPKATEQKVERALLDAQNRSGGDRHRQRRVP